MLCKIMNRTIKSGVVGSISEGMVGKATEGVLPQAESGRMATHSANTNDKVLTGQTSAGQTSAQEYTGNRASLVAPAGQEYVDPYLFETGYFESREEYEEVSRRAKIKSRARS